MPNEGRKCLRSFFLKPTLFSNVADRLAVLTQELEEDGELDYEVGDELELQTVGRRY